MRVRAIFRQSTRFGRAIATEWQSIAQDLVECSGTQQHVDGLIEIGSRMERERKRT